MLSRAATTDKTIGIVKAAFTPAVPICRNGRKDGSRGGGMDIAERLARERRARLAAERLLELKSRELVAANERLSQHARALSGMVAEQQRAAASARTETEALKGRNSHALSEMERAQTAAVMAERRLWDSIDTIPDGFAVFDASQRLVVANRAWLAPFEGHGVAVGTPYARILQIAADAGLVATAGATPGDWVAGMLARWRSDPIPSVELQMAGGGWLRLLDRRAHDGDIVSLTLNVTEQMLIWSAVEAIPDGFVLFDRTDRLVICNSSYRAIYAGSEPAMRRGATFESILRYGLDLGQYADAVGQEEEWLRARLAEHGTEYAQGDHQLADGRWIRSIDKATPDGGRVGLRVDFTEMKAQQAALEAARLAAEAASRAKSAFLANMSHEIRTPMNGVIGMAELLCDTMLNEEQRLFAETIKSSGEALLQIINDILDYSKIEAERLTLHPAPFDLERTIHEVAMLLQPRARARGIDLLIDYYMFLPTRYIADQGRIRQVLINLVGNAVKFTEAGHVLIRVVGIETPPGRQQLHVTVEDTGIGIAADQLEHIFGEFNQVEGEANRKYEGTGLGLAITRRLIERMEGAIWVDSEPGRGSCFGFRLTLPPAEEATTLPRAAIPVRRALVVDDQLINRTILERQLAPAGIAVTLCRSGAEALAALARDAEYDVVITDHEMPEMDGLTLAARIREAGRTMPVVLLSSNPAAAREGSGAAHLAAILQKPILRAELYHCLQALAEEAPLPDAVMVPLGGGADRAMRLLVAEDNRTNQLIFQKMVRDLDLDLHFACDGREAVGLCAALEPDLVFMDISMPIMDGREAATAIRAAEARGAHVPIVALTAHAMQGDAETILSAGIDRYLTKPLRKTAITAVLAEFRPEGTRPFDPAEEGG